jgi:putative transposase
MSAAKAILSALPEWAKEIPYQIKKIAVEDAYKAFSNGCKKAKATKQAFTLSFRSAKDPKQSCFIPSAALSEKGIYYTKSGILKMAENLPENPRDSRLVCEHNRWYVIVPYKVAVTVTENQGRVVALDPGIRTFMTGFAQDGAFKIGQGDFAKLARLGRFMDDLVSSISKAKAPAKRRMRKTLSRMKHKVWDLIDELHYKTIKFLTDNYDLILLPTFETSQMVAKSNRKIKSKTVRAMTTFSFHKFGMRLQAKVKELGKVVIRVNEAYTSKTASWSGEVKNIGSSKTVRSGGVVLDRDLNGARGIFLRALVDKPLSEMRVHWLTFVSKCQLKFIGLQTS